MSAPESHTPDASGAAIRFVTRDVTPEEVAAVVAVLSATGGGADPAVEQRSDWAGRARVGWRSSGLPTAGFGVRLPR